MRYDCAHRKLCHMDNPNCGAIKIRTKIHKGISLTLYVIRRLILQTLQVGVKRHVWYAPGRDHRSTEPHIWNVDRLGSCGATQYLNT